MLTLIRNGGWPMFFILAFGAITLATSFWYALRPSARQEGFIRFMGHATLFATLSGMFAAMAQVFYYIASKEPPQDQRFLILCEGMGESLSAPILGFSFLALVALMSAVGKRRLDARELPATDARG